MGCALGLSNISDLIIDQTHLAWRLLGKTWHEHAAIFKTRNSRIVGTGTGLLLEASLQNPCASIAALTPENVWCG